MHNYITKAIEIYIKKNKNLFIIVILYIHIICCIFLTHHEFLKIYYHINFLE